MPPDEDPGATTPPGPTDPGDPFPRERFVALVRRLPAYGRLAWRLGREPLLSRARRAAVLGGAAYLASPIDLVPGFIPVLGQLDDIAVVLATLRVALDGLSPARRQAHLAAVGLADDDLAADLRTLGSTAAWTGRTGLRAGRRIGSVGARALIRGSRRLGAAGVHGARALATRRPRRGDRDAEESAPSD